MTGYTNNNSHQFAVDRLGQLNSHAVNTPFPAWSQCEPRMFSAIPAVPRNRDGRVRQSPSYVPGYRPDTHPYSLDILVVFAIMEKLQNKVRNMEQELVQLRAKMCHCHDSMNRQMPEADSVTRPNNGDHNGSAQSMQASEEISVSPEHGSVDQGSLQEQGEAPAMSAEANGNTSNSLPDQSELPAVNELNGPSHASEPCQVEKRQKLHSKKIVCPHCSGTHFIWFCNSFKSLSLDNRWKRARELKLCFSCLLPHLARNCRKRAICGLNHCKLTHNRLLHDEERRQIIWYSRYDTRSIRPPGERNWNRATSVKSTMHNESIVSGKIFASREPSSGKTLIVNEVSTGMPPSDDQSDFGSSLEAHATETELSLEVHATESETSLEAHATESESTTDSIPVPPGRSLDNYESSLEAHGTESELSTAPSSGQFELSDLEPTVPVFPTTPLKKFADRLRERFKGKHRKVLESFYY